MNEAGTDSATAPSRFLDAPPMPQARAAAKRIREELDSLLSQELGKYASEDTSLVDLVRLPAERGQSEVISIGRI
ncbi:MAG TPA: hypothetical protein VNO32_52160 [Candidatus Acidoferrum sp.]|nr:hypothetical protein [Candidatus Acidoferrum sp.]